MKPIHEKELRELATCAVCDRKIGQTEVPILFWKIIAERHFINIDAVRRQTGLTMMLGGNAAIAAAMGPDEPMTIPVKMDSDAIGICDPCMLKRLPEIFEKSSKEFEPT